MHVEAKGTGLLPTHFPQHPDEYRPERPVLLAVDQQLGEGRDSLGSADPVARSRQHEDVEQLGTPSEGT
jgi:hypothetical protein